MNELQKYHDKLPVEDLVKIVFFERGKIKKEARNSAKDVLVNRGITNKEIDAIRKEIRKRKNSERKVKLKEKDNGYGARQFLWEIVWEFLLDILFSIIRF